MKRRTTAVVRPSCQEDRARASSTPIFQTATFGIASSDSENNYDYSRSGNPTRRVLEEKIAELENGKAALAYSSGMAALHAVLGLVPQGGAVIAAADLYGGSFRILSRLSEQRNLTVTFVDTANPDELTAALEYDVDLVLVESPSNPRHRVCDIRRLSTLCRARDALLVVDNSLMSPWLQRPLDLGADIVLESATKFLNGHADVTAGVVSSRDESLLEKLTWDHNATGAALGPFDSWLVLRGLETLGVRVEAQQKTASFLAGKLAEHPAVAEVCYVGNKSHPGYDLHREQADGPGSVFSFRLHSPGLVDPVINGTDLFATTVSFGSTRSTISVPSSMSHASIPKHLAARFAPPPSLIRVSIGLEDKDDLWRDLSSALEGAEHGSTNQRDLSPEVGVDYSLSDSKP